MANPQPDQYTRISNEYLEALLQYNIPGNPRRILDTIIRYTWGFHNKSNPIGITLFKKSTGMNEKNIRESIKWLQSRKLIGINTTKYRHEYSIVKDYTKWKDGGYITTSFPKHGGNDTLYGTQEETNGNDTPKLNGHDTITKRKKKTDKGDHPKISSNVPFSEKELLEIYNGNNFTFDFEKFVTWWDEGTKVLKRPKSAMLNWQGKEPPPPEPEKPKPKKGTKEWYESGPTMMPTYTILNTRCVKDIEKFQDEDFIIQGTLDGYDFKRRKEFTPEEALKFLAKVNPEWQKSGYKNLFDKLDWKFIKLYYNLERSEFDPNYKEELPI